MYIDEVVNCGVMVLMEDTDMDRVAMLILTKWKIRVALMGHAA